MVILHLGTADMVYSLIHRYMMAQLHHVLRLTTSRCLVLQDQMERCGSSALAWRYGESCAEACDIPHFSIAKHKSPIRSWTDQEAFNVCDAYVATDNPSLRYNTRYHICILSRA